MDAIVAKSVWYELPKFLVQIISDDPKQGVEKEYTLNEMDLGLFLARNYPDCYGNIFGGYRDKRCRHYLYWMPSKEVTTRNSHKVNTSQQSAGNTVKIYISQL
jgi:hypothetical protein